MALSLTQQQIGQRVAALRKLKKFSQEELAARLEMSRSSLAQLELGNRGVDVLELHQLSLVLGFSMDGLLAPDFTMKSFHGDQEEDEIKPDSRGVEQLRISIPTLKVAKFRNVLLYILERCAGKPNIGETVLNKLLYFCDFNYYELYEESLTGARYKKLPYGPVPQKMDHIIHQMVERNQLKRIKSAYHGYPQTRYMPLEKADLTHLSAAEKTVIDNVLLQMSDWTATTISDYSHKDMPWLATGEGQYIDYNLAFYREMPFSVRMYEDELG